MLTAVGGKAILGVNLESDSKRLASTEVADFDRYVGPSLIDSFELGNEPEFFPVALPPGHPPHDYPYKIAHYGKQFSTIASALGGAALAGPASGAPNWLSHLGTILRDLPSRLTLVTMHAYPTKNCSRLSQVARCLARRLGKVGLRQKASIVMQPCRRQAGTCTSISSIIDNEGFPQWTSRQRSVS